MAGNWHNSITSREHKGVGEPPLPKTDYSSSVIHATKKPLFEKIKAKLSSIDIKGSMLLGLKYGLFILPVIATFILINRISNRQTLDSSAGTNTAKLYFQNNQIILPPDNDVQVLLTTDGSVGFVKTEINFDTTKVKMLSEVDITASPFKRVVKVTSMAEANSTGKLYIILGLEPASIANPPIGNLQLGKFKIGSNTQNANVSTNISFNVPNSQIVNLDQTLFSLSSVNTSLLINPVATMTPVATATTTSTIAPTSQPSPTVASSTSTPTPVAKSCSQCHKRKCDNVCDTKRENSQCSDCP